MNELVLTDFNSRLHAEDLAFLLGMQQKDLRKLCARLREDRLISVYGYCPPDCVFGSQMANMTFCM